MSKDNFDDYLDRSLTQLDKDISPNKELWHGIERAIVTPDTRVKTVPYWPKLMAVAACIIAGLLTLNVLYNTQQPTQVMAMSEYFEQQKNTLLVQYKNQTALTDNWQAQLQELEDAEQAIKQALENEPKNKALLKMLAQIYQQQLDLINKVHAPRWQHI